MDDFKLLLELNRVHVVLIADTVIQELIELTDKDFLLSEDDSGLINVWEEICIQKQVEESFHWDAYYNTIGNFIGEEFKKQQEPIKRLIRYVGSLSNNNYNTDEEYEGSDEDSIEEIRKAIIEKAINYQSENIDLYLNNNYGEEDGEDEDDFKEDRFNH